MAKKSGLSKILEFIGLVDESEAEAKPRPSSGYSESAYDEPRYTPRARATAPDRSGERRYSSERRRPDDAAGAAYSRRDPYSDATYSQSAGLPAVSTRAVKTSPGTMVYYLRSLSECGDVIEDLIYGKSVLLNLEETDAVLTQRIVDTLAGATFALRAKIRKISEKMYLIAPENVEVNMTRSVERRY